MLKMAASLLVILAASLIYLQAAQPGGLCAAIGHSHLCGDKAGAAQALGVAAAD